MSPFLSGNIQAPIVEQIPTYGVQQPVDRPYQQDSYQPRPLYQPGTYVNQQQYQQPNESYPVDEQKKGFFGKIFG